MSQIMQGVLSRSFPTSSGPKLWASQSHLHIDNPCMDKEIRTCALMEAKMATQHRVAIPQCDKQEPSIPLHRTPLALLSRWTWYWRTTLRLRHCELVPPRCDQRRKLDLNTAQHSFKPGPAQNSGERHNTQSNLSILASLGRHYSTYTCHPCI